MAKSKDIDTSTNASQREMLVSQCIVCDVDVNFHIEVRYGPRNWKAVATVFKECIREDRGDYNEMKMKDLISGMQDGMQLIWQTLEEKEIEDRSWTSQKKRLCQRR
jgi:hypothetical protein